MSPAFRVLEVFTLLGLGILWGVGVGSSLWRQFKERKQATKRVSKGLWVH